jgi:hypothetical protein
MKIRCTTTSISTLFLSLWLAMMIPANLGYVLTWKERYFVYGHASVWNYLIPIGIANLGIVMIGLIVLWAGYRKNERWAWFVLLIIFLCFLLPFSAQPLLSPMLREIYRVHQSPDLLGLFRGAWQCQVLLPSLSQGSVGLACFAVGMQFQILEFLMASVALLLPVKAFFWKSHTRV